MALGHIEPGSSGHKRPGHETAYPSSPPHIQASILFMLPAKLAISYTNIFPFFKNDKFWANGCHVKGSLPAPLHMQDTVTKSYERQVKTRGM